MLYPPCPVVRPLSRSMCGQPKHGGECAFNPDDDSRGGCARWLRVKVIRNRGGLRLADFVSLLHLPTARDGSASHFCEGCGVSWCPRSEADERSNRNRRGYRRILARSLSCRRRRPSGRSIVATQGPAERRRASQHPEEMRDTVSPSSCKLGYGPDESAVV